ncbi:YicC family protein [Cognatishimia sp. WU-CL00825]|uniref:YicC/YloC family endoribonuclease n=1 Tax=Cognatishimia sp. WU-CL00825 TaxID=3127658 RepID=UPI0031069AC3
MLNSMTGFASAKGQADGYTWTWDLRSVNSKGLDLRMRVPDWIEGLEPLLRTGLAKAAARGAVTLSLRVYKTEENSALALNKTALDTVLKALADIETDAMDRGISLSPSNAAEILALRGVMDTASAESNTDGLRAALVAGLPALIAAFNEMRASEGQALENVLSGQITEIETLTNAAQAVAEQRKAEVATNLKNNLAKVLENVDAMDESRLAQELAVLAVKSDVTEELDRLMAHVAAATELVAKGSPVGRKLDFLMQEFNREANTLCSKAQNVDLTRVGLDLKAVIDQMREQVQNVE